MLLAAIVAVFVVATQGRDPDLEASEQEGREYIMHLDKMAGARKNRASLAEWAYTSNITEENEEKRVCFKIQIITSLIPVPESRCNICVLCNENNYLKHNY